MTHNVNKMKGKNFMVILIEAKTLDKIQQKFMIKIIGKLNIEEMYLNIKNAHIMSPQLT